MTNHSSKIEPEVAQHLTVREALIASLRQDGKTPAEIAKNLGTDSAKAAAEIKRVDHVVKALQRYFETTNHAEELRHLRASAVKLRQIKKAHELLMQRLTDADIADQIGLPKTKIAAVRVQILETKTETARFLNAVSGR